MPRYSDELIEEVRSRNDIVDVISQYVRLSKRAVPTSGCASSIMRRPVLFRSLPINRCTIVLAATREAMLFTSPDAVRELHVRGSDGSACRAGGRRPSEAGIYGGAAAGGGPEGTSLEINKEAAKYFFRAASRGARKTCA